MGGGVVRVAQPSDEIIKPSRLVGQGSGRILVVNKRTVFAPFCAICLGSA